MLKIKELKFVETEGNDYKCHIFGIYYFSIDKDNTAYFGNGGSGMVLVKWQADSFIQAKRACRAFLKRMFKCVVVIDDGA